jgi:DNA-binding NtrC family response regulator
MTDAPFRNVRVLVVDDEPALLELTRRHLSSVGYQCANAANAEQAMQIFETKRFNVLLTDVRMAKMDGLDLAKKLRERFAGLAIIFMTGKPDTKGIKVAQAVGAVQYIVKPVDISTLTETAATAARWNMAQLIGRAADKYYAFRGGRMGGADGKLQRIKTEIKNSLLVQGDAEFITEMAYAKNPTTTRLFAKLDERMAPIMRTV